MNRRERRALARSAVKRMGLKGEAKKQAVRALTEEFNRNRAMEMLSEGDEREVKRDDEKGVRVTERKSGLQVVRRLLGQ